MNDPPPPANDPTPRERAGRDLGVLIGIAAWIRESVADFFTGLRDRLGDLFRRRPPPP